MTAATNLFRKLARALPIICALSTSALPLQSAHAATAPVQPASAAKPAAVTAPAPVAPAAPAAPVVEAGVTLTPKVAARLPELRTFSAKMGVPLEQLLRGMEGLERIYERNYAEARNTFRDLEQRFPESAIGPFGQVMMSQAQMGENLDFLQENVYQHAYEESMKRMDAAIDQGQAVAFNRFLRGCAKGVNSLYLYRKDKLMSALSEGISALGDIETANKLDPNFADPYVGLGVYNYWRSALTLRYKNLPFFPDKRTQGLAQLEKARNQGIITPVIARLALGYSYMDFRQPEKALGEADALIKAYPNNVLSYTLAGQTYLRLRKPAQSKASYEKVLEIDPKNKLVLLALGNHALNREQNASKAAEYYERYVQDIPNEAYLPMARTRLGDAYWLQGKGPQAEEQWKLALKADSSYKLAKNRMEGKRPLVKPTNRSVKVQVLEDRRKAMDARQERAMEAMRRSGALGTVPTSSGPRPAQGQKASEVKASQSKTSTPTSTPTSTAPASTSKTTTPTSTTPTTPASK